MNLSDYHSYYGGQAWKVTPKGVVVAGKIERTFGQPITVRRIWGRFQVHIEQTGVPVALVLACIATESGGRAGAVRCEPGYVSDEATPHRVSVGLMQTLLSTASEVVGHPVDRAWLTDPGNSIQAGAGYIKRQAPLTHYDPVLVAAAYNSGGVYEERDERNPWRLRCYPLGTGQHISRFVRFYNDAVAVLA